MDYAEYIQKIQFHSFGPDSTNFDPALEIENTILPSDEETMKQRLGDLCRIPKMSTFAMGAMINDAVSRMTEGSCYLNVGVWNGFSFLAGLIDNPDKECIGIDNFSEFDGPRTKFLERFERYKSARHSFFEEDFIDYFTETHQLPIGVYFYDGDHTYENQLKGLKMAEPFFTDDCIILVDDTNWYQPRHATRDFISVSSNRYDVLLDRTTICNQHPTFWNGVIVLRRCT